MNLKIENEQGQCYNGDGKKKYCVAIRIKALTEMNYTHTVMVML